MRYRLSILAMGLLALASAPAVCQTSGSSEKSTSKPKWPTEIGGKSLEQWVKEIKNQDPSVRETAMRAVPFFGPPAGKEVVKPLSDILRNDKDASCRVHAALTLSALAEYITGDDAFEAIRVLAERLDDPQAIVRLHAAMALGSFSGRATKAIPSLVRCLPYRGSWEVRRAVIGALRSVAENKLGPDPEAVTAIATLLLSTGDNYEKSGQVRMEAVMTLGALGGPRDPKALMLSKQALTHSLKDPDKPVEIWATVALMAVNDKITDQGLSDVAKHLKGKDMLAKVHAANALLSIGKEAKPRIPDIVEMLGDKDPIAKATAIDVLGQFGSTASGAVPALEKIQNNKDETEYFRKSAEAAIKAINGETKTRPTSAEPNK
jgi:HEAT repeat protein